MLRELRHGHFLLVTYEISQNLVLQSIDHPNAVVFASRQNQGRCLMPLHKVKVFIGHRVKGTLQGEPILHVPHSEHVIHATGD